MDDLESRLRRRMVGDTGHDVRYRQRSRIVFGLFVIAVGLFALLDNLNVFDARLVRPYWPLVFVAAGVLRLAQGGRGRGLFAGLAFIGTGVVLTLHNLGLLRVDFRAWWSLFLIIGGVAVLARGVRPGKRELGGSRRHGGLDERSEHGSRVDASAVLSAIVLKNDSPRFEGGELGTMMGSIEVDLRQATIAGEAVLHLSIFMGNVAIKVPREWSVTIDGMPMLGGIEDRTVQPTMPGQRLIVVGSVFMGGVEIGN